jgi:DNA-binding IscR family transcriptional regulator
MPPDPTDRPLDPKGESAVVARLLDPPDARTVAELHELLNFPAERIDAAVTNLVVAGVVRATHGGGVYLTEPSRHLDALGMIGL